MSITVKDMIERTIEQFRAGDLPQKIAVCLVKCPDVPSSHWSINNQILQMVQGTSDSRTYEGWRSVGRYPRRGSHYDVFILKPYDKTFTKKELVKNEQTGELEEVEQEHKIIRFVLDGRFSLSQTDGKPLPTYQPKTVPPFRDVLKLWNIKLDYANMVGAYAHTNGKDNITTATEDPQTVIHELMHIADARALKTEGKALKGGQDQEQEIVAELGACTLAEMFGLKTNKGFSFEYIEHYSRANKNREKVARECIRVLNRVQKAITVILEAQQQTETTVIKPDMPPKMPDSEPVKVPEITKVPEPKPFDPIIPEQVKPMIEMPTQETVYNLCSECGVLTDHKNKKGFCTACERLSEKETVKPIEHVPAKTEPTKEKTETEQTIQLETGECRCWDSFDGPLKVFKKFIQATNEYRVLEEKTDVDRFARKWQEVKSGVKVLTLGPTVELPEYKCAYIETANKLWTDSNPTSVHSVRTFKGQSPTRRQTVNYKRYVTLEFQAGYVKAKTILPLDIEATREELITIEPLKNRLERARLNHVANQVRDGYEPITPEDSELIETVPELQGVD